MSSTIEPLATSQPRLRDALDHIRPQMAALSRGELLPINLDPLFAAAVALGALPDLLDLRPRLADLATLFDLANLDQLETLALALIQAHTLYIGVESRSETLPVLSRQAIELRAQLLADATILARRGHLPTARRWGLKGTNGYRNIASDLLTICGLLRSYWPSIVNQTAVTEADLDRAEILGDEMIRAIGIRDQASELSITAADQRRRVYTLFVRAYDQIRRAVTCLRWQNGDADRIAPSLYGKRKAGHKKAKKVDPATNANVATTSTVPQLAAAACPDRNETRIGLPGADPFLH
jgi:hypothetical protein